MTNPYTFKILTRFTLDGGNADQLRRAQTVNRFFKQRPSIDCDESQFADVLESLEQLMSVARRARACEGSQS